MTTHSFLIEPGIWLGEGKITFNASSEAIIFYTRWMILKSEKNFICTQEVEMQGVEGKVRNMYEISNVSSDSFILALDNELMGKVQGKGVLDPKRIAWEIRGQKDFEGFEVFELQDNRDYKFHSEFFSADQLRTIIDGRLWKKAE